MSLRKNRLFIKEVDICQEYKTEIKIFTTTRSTSKDAENVLRLTISSFYLLPLS